MLLFFCVVVVAACCCCVVLAAAVRIHVRLLFDSDLPHLPFTSFTFGMGGGGREMERAATSYYSYYTLSFVFPTSVCSFSILCAPVSTKRYPVLEVPVCVERNAATVTATPRLHRHITTPC